MALADLTDQGWTMIGPFLPPERCPWARQSELSHGT